MSKQQQKKRNQVKEARLEIVAQLYKRGNSVRKIRDEVMRRLDLPKYSTSTVHSDIQTLLQEWRENRYKDMDDALELELARIDETVQELWDQWEKSKADYVQTTRTRKGAPVKNGSGNEEGGDGQQQQQQPQREQMRTYNVERTEKEVIGLGNTAYIAEIRQQLMERRKLLGLYAPEKREMSGTMSFAQLLMESGKIDEAEEEIRNSQNMI